MTFTLTAGSASELFARACQAVSATGRPAAASGFSDAAVLVIDSLGETRTTSIDSGRVLPGGGIRYRTRESVSDPASLGYAYGAPAATSPASQAATGPAPA